MKSTIDIIFVEDVAADAEAVENELRKGGLDVHLQRVEAREDFLRELNANTPDVILSDHGLPTFNGFEALTIAHEKCPDVPFIFVTNALTREMEIEKLASGVTDFVLKTELGELSAVIRRALRRADVMKPGMTPEERTRIVKKLFTLLAEYEAANGHLPICSHCKKIRDKENAWHSPEYFFAKYLNLNFTHGICPDCAQKYYR